MSRELRPALVMVALFTLLLGLAYPLAVTGVAQVMFPAQANGSLVVLNGRVVGSSLVGQAFSQDRYFHGRPSATVMTDPNDASRTIAAPYNASNSAGSNLAPTSKALIERIAADVAMRQAQNAKARVPTDLVTSSGSGLDPHISPDAAMFQVPRVAKARNMTEDRLLELVNQHIEDRTLGFLGEPRVNVLALNLALDRAAAR